MVAYLPSEVSHAPYPENLAHPPKAALLCLKVCVRAANSALAGSKGLSMSCCPSSLPLSSLITLLYSNPSVTYKKVACPREITALTGCVRSDDAQNYVTPQPASPVTQPQQDAATTLRLTTSTKAASTSAKTTSTQAAATKPATGGTGIAAIWGQCGGKGYTGPTACAL